MRRATALLALVLLASACGSSASPPRAERTSGGLVDVSNVLPLRGAFNRDTGRTRLLLVLSPT